MTTCTHGYASPKSCLDCMEEVGVSAEPVRPERSERSPWEAQFPGSCPVCDEPIDIGNFITITNRERYVHARCVK
jgi:hypothetical protein